MYNPRFPHTLKVFRAAEDVNGDVIYDGKGDPIWEQLTLTYALYLDDDPMRDADGNPVCRDSDEINFGYRTSTGGLRTSGEVIVADFKIAMPWLRTEIRTGDRVICTDYQRTFEAKVLKCTTYNLGTNMWIDEIKN